MAHITFVKKILTNGELCKKCQEASERLQSEELINSIDHIAIADERDADSEGIRLANKYCVAHAPFFLVEDESDNVTVFDIYFKFRKFMTKPDIGQDKPTVL